MRWFIRLVKFVFVRLVKCRCLWFDVKFVLIKNC